MAQSSGVYGSDNYGTSTYSCNDGDVACQTTQAPNTGIFTPENTPILVGGFVGVALVTTIITYAILRKIKKNKSIVK